MYGIDYRIPQVDLAEIRKPHYQIPLDHTSLLFAEEMVDVRDYGLSFLSWHAIDDGSNAPYGRPIAGSRTDGWLRRTFAEKLARADRLLAAYDAQLLILDAYRPIECQHGLWRFFWELGRQANPAASDEELRQYASRYLRDPRSFDRNDARTFPIHSTGASIDVVLRSRSQGHWLDMGSRFDEYTEASVTDYFERQLLLGAISQDDHRLWNRRLLHWALSSEDITNDPLLYWHHDWGNQIWIKVKRAVYGDAMETAWYGYIDAPPLPRPCSWSACSRTDGVS
ncbi:M15 family metallopeptidase [Dyella subtropica]|uniref:M15 family metallopeptidase n=1 Tax=Dyella subtropica TaxID=2992127 RepID=UPI0022591F27|nr:M15 family metallopeptidase [Dyella subtropica]